MTKMALVFPATAFKPEPFHRRSNTNTVPTRRDCDEARRHHREAQVFFENKRMEGRQQGALGHQQKHQQRQQQQGEQASFAGNSAARIPWDDNDNHNKHSKHTPLPPPLALLVWPFHCQGARRRRRRRRQERKKSPEKRVRVWGRRWPPLPLPLPLPLPPPAPPGTAEPHHLSPFRLLRLRCRRLTSPSAPA